MSEKPLVIFIVIFVLNLILSGCTSVTQVPVKVDNTNNQIGEVQHITQSEAQKIMSSTSDYTVIDVRTFSEYAEGHISGAINIPNESIGTDITKSLPNKDQVLLLYCRSGVRSRDAAQKLVDLGYTKVYEFGGILSWTGEITK